MHGPALHIDIYQFYWLQKAFDMVNCCLKGRFNKVEKERIPLVIQSCVSFFSHLTILHVDPKTLPWLMINLFKLIL